MVLLYIISMNSETRTETVFNYFLRSITQVHHIYTIILLMSVCLSVLANYRSRFLLDRLGICVQLFVSTDSTSCHEFASQIGLDIFVYVKNTQNYHKYRVAYATVFLNEAATGDSTPAKRGRQLRHGWVHRPIENDNQNGDGGGLECVCARVCVHACACVRECMCACVCA